MRRVRRYTIEMVPSFVWVMTCNCGIKFEPKRSDAKYCSDKCRFAAAYVRRMARAEQGAAA